MRGAGLVAILMLSACAFSSEGAFFSDPDAAQPVADGTRFVWQAPDDEAMDVTFHRNGAAYDLIERNHPDEPMTGVLLVAVPETSEDDYIVQWNPDPGQDARTYAFMWPVGDGYRVFSNPSAFADVEAEKPQAAFCEERAYGECAFATRERLLAYYHGVVYPALAARGETLEGSLEMTPAPDGK
jgi:hypothetical protein